MANGLIILDREDYSGGGTQSNLRHHMRKNMRDTNLKSLRNHVSMKDETKEAYKKGYEEGWKDCMEECGMSDM